MSSGSVVAQDLALKCRGLEAWGRESLWVLSCPLLLQRQGSQQLLFSTRYLWRSLQKNSPSTGISRLCEFTGWIFSFPCAVRVSRQGHPNSMMSCNNFITEQSAVECPHSRRARASYTQSKREHWGVRQPQGTGCGAWLRLPTPGANQSWRDPEPANATGIMSAPSCQHKKGLSCLHVPVLTWTQTASWLSVAWVSTRDPSESTLPGIHRLLVMSLWIVLNLLP